MLESLQESLKSILAIQEFDIKMIRLMRVKKEQQKELSKIQVLKEDIRKQVVDKEAAMMDIKKQIRMGETQIKELLEKVVKLEGQQAAVRKMDEFNALTHEITSAGRERAAIEDALIRLVDRLAVEEDLLVTLKENLSVNETNSQVIEKEIDESIEKINLEGQDLMVKRDLLKDQVSPDLFMVYMRLLKNKKDRVVVPIENRTCSGCHIVLTAQHENLIRKGDRLVFCEHCSRVLFWQEVEVVEGEAPARRRRRRVPAV